MRSVLLLSLVLLIFSSCNYIGKKRISGNGKVISKQISAAQFNSVQVSGAIDLSLSQAGQSAASIETDENIMEYIDVYTDGNTLVVKIKKGYNLRPTKKIIVHASAPAFKEITSSGSGVITTKNMISGSEPLFVDVSGSGEMHLQVNVPQLTTTLSGSGTMEVRGSAQNYSTSISGSGDIKTFDLVTENTQVEISGSADAEVNASKNLEVKISGSGNVQYRGNPSVKKSISGSGSVEKVN